VSAWDTTVVSRLHPGSVLEQHVVERAWAGDPVAIGAPTVMEAMRGLQTRAAVTSAGARTLSRFDELLSRALVEVLPLDRHAATVAGRVRGEHPIPPTGARRKGVKPEQRAAWVLDIQIAACAWTNGRSIVTENVRDFERLSELIATLYPGVPKLVVAEASSAALG
jgi:predicted nucleic acid-binding protein